MFSKVCVCPRGDGGPWSFPGGWVPLVFGPWSFAWGEGGTPVRLVPGGVYSSKDKGNPAQRTGYAAAGCLLDFLVSIKFRLRKEVDTFVRLRKEVDTLIGDKKVIAYEDVMNMEYATMLMKVFLSPFLE